MKHRHWSRFALVALAAAACGAAAVPAAAAPGPAATATAYLQARAAAVTAADPAALLAPWVAPGARFAGTERAIARGTALRAAQQGHRIDVVSNDVAVLNTTVGTDGATATVKAHVLTTTLWRASMEPNTEASGMDHDVSLQLIDGSWRVVGDTYYDVVVPSDLEAAGASPATVRGAAKKLERASLRIRVATPVVGRRWVADATNARRYNDILYYDRNAATAYADSYALSYCPTCVRFGADCANFVSQAARQGKMPVNAGAYDYGWWYNKNGTGSPGDDTYSMSWINVGKQMAWWNARRSDWASSINSLTKGDAVYYDWSGDGVWDHVAVVVGTNSAGQKIVDAHTSDYYHTYWKMGWTATTYKFAHVRDQWVV